MVFVRVVEHAADGEVHVVPVRNARVIARAVALAALDRRADAGAPPVHVEPMLVGVPLVLRVQVSVVQVVRVVPVLDGAVSAAGAVPVRMRIVGRAAHSAMVRPREGRVKEMRVTHGTRRRSRALRLR